jgi:hypothetical protein
MISSAPQDWQSCFDQIFERHEPANIAAINAVLAPLSRVEASSIVATLSNPWPPSSPYYSTYIPVDPDAWNLPTQPIPFSYISFLQWADGASWQTGDRQFACFGCKHLREYLLHYHFPEYMPGALPIGLDGDGVFGFFDLRNTSSDTVWAIGSGALDWKYAVKVADSFVQFCRGTRAVGDIYNAA